MTRKERISWLKQIENDIYVDSLEITHEEYMKSRAIHETIEALQTEPCEDCISRQAVIEQSIVLRDISNPDKEWEVVTVATIKHLKSVQPEPKTGKWNKIIEEPSNWREAWHYECSNCGNYISGHGKYKYCPNYGAKMEEGE